MPPLDGLCHRHPDRRHRQKHKENCSESHGFTLSRLCDKCGAGVCQYRVKVLGGGNGRAKRRLYFSMRLSAVSLALILLILSGCSPRQLPEQQSPPSEPPRALKIPTPPDTAQPKFDPTKFGALAKDLNQFGFKLFDVGSIFVAVADENMSHETLILR